MPSTAHEPARGHSGGGPLAAWWLGRTAYREAWELQHRIVAARQAGLIGDQLLLLEHEPVLTLGRHSDPAHVLASPAGLAARGIELISTERGGEVTYHGPGQLTAYVIVDLADRGLAVRPLVQALEGAMITTCAGMGVEAGPREGHPGCWCGDGGRKIGAIGVRIEHGVSYHGIALNVTARLQDFELIDACGLPWVESTSIARERGEAGPPSTESVAVAGRLFAAALATSISAELRPVVQLTADPAVARARLEEVLAGVEVGGVSAAGTRQVASAAAPQAASSR